MTSAPESRSVCVFCASSDGIDARYLELAAELGAELGSRGLTLVSGGGRVSMMGALARSARAHGAWTVGVIPEALMGWEVADDEADELVVTADMRTRKATMDARSDAFLVLPGGLGTLEEFLEAWVGRSLGMHAKPIVVLDPWDDFAGLRAVVSGLVEHGFVREVVSAEVEWAHSLPEALDALERAWAHPLQAERPSGRPTALDALEAD